MSKYETLKNEQISLEKKSDNGFLKVIFLLTWLTCIGFLFDKQILVSLGNYTISILIFLSTIYFSIKKNNKTTLLIAICIVIFFAVNLSYKIINGNYILEYRNYIYITLIFLLILCKSYFKVRKTDILFMTTLSTILTFLFFMKLADNKMYEYYSFDFALNLNFSNPNVLGSVLLTNMIYITLGLLCVNNKKVKIFLIGIVLANVYLIYLTESRSSLYTVILFLIMVIFFKSKFKISENISKVIGIVPLLCVVFSTLISKIVSLNLIGSSGKIGLSSREEIWRYVVTNSFQNTENLLFGSNHDAFISNPHNIYLYLLWDYGLFISILLITLIIIQTIKVGKNINNSFENISFYGFSMIILNNSFESHLFIGIIGISFLSFLLLAQYPQKEENKSRRYL